MLIYALIGLCLALAGVAGLQMTYMLYLDRLDRERKRRLAELERRCRTLASRLEDAEQRIREQESVIDTLFTENAGDEAWAEVIDES